MKEREQHLDFLRTLRSSVRLVDMFLNMNSKGVSKPASDRRGDEVNLYSRGSVDGSVTLQAFMPNRNKLILMDSDVTCDFVKIHLEENTSNLKYSSQLENKLRCSSFHE